MGMNLTICTEVCDEQGAWQRAEPLKPNAEWDDAFWWDYILEDPARALDEPVVERELVYFGKFGTLMVVFVYGVTVRDPEDSSTLHLLQPISETRGLPADATEETVAEFYLDPWDPGDLHTVSWLTLREILDYDWDQPYPEVRYGAIGSVPPNAPYPEASFDEEWEPFGQPVMAPAGYFVQGYIRRVESCREKTAWFHEHTLPKLEALGAPDDVRILFHYA